MSDFLNDTPMLARHVCPGCEPEADPTREIVDTRWCSAHAPREGGSEDAQVTSQSWMTGGAEADGETCRRMAEIIHRAAGR